MLLNLLKHEEEKKNRGALKIFFGMCAGVGKTYDMLKDAHEAHRKGIDTVIGVVETHGRPETEALVAGLPVVPMRKSEYRGTLLSEFDLDAVLARKPKLVLVDELAHTNAPGSRHAKRYQDVLELLDNGISVFTTLNVQHLESRADTVAQITGSVVRETVPDSIFEAADEVEVIDISPDELLKRLSEGKVYTPDRSRLAIQHFFRKGNLTALREMSLRITAERVDQQLRTYKQTERISDTWKSGARLVVGISEDPAAIALIRWARRISYTLNASWVAVHVEGSHPLDAAARAQLARTLALAKDLGAEVISTADDDIAAALVRVAREQNATQIIVGKPGRRAFGRPSRLVADLLERSHDVDVYVVGHDEDDKRRPSFAGRRLFVVQSGVPQYLVAAAIVISIALLCFPFSRFFGYRTVSLIILLTVSLLPLRLGPGPVLLGAGIGALAWDFLYIPPLFTFSIIRAEDVMMLGMFFAVALVTGVLSARVRARERAVFQREQRTAALYALTKDLSSAHSQDEVVSAAVTNLAKHFDADVAIYLGDADGEMSAAPHAASTWAPDEKEFSVAAWTYWNERKAGRHTDTLPFAQATYFSMSGPRYPLGVIGVRLRAEEKISVDLETSLENFIAQISSAVERELLNDVTKRSIVVAESERLYKTLFNSISHELRTPIAAILGASENLLATRQMLPAQSDNAKEIHIAAERLNRLVANLLDMTRLESGLIQPKSDWCDVRDLVNAVVNGLQRELAGHLATVDLPDGMPLVRLDFGLIEQALTNLVDNAAVHTPAGTAIRIEARTEGNDCVIVVSDAGPGIPSTDLERVFEKFYRAAGSSTGGTGLGLTIAKGFIEAHRGTLSVKNRPSGGAEFMVRIPTEFTSTQA
jgi:two-component system sensor histidine kinase KdpD